MNNDGIVYEAESGLRCPNCDRYMIAKYSFQSGTTYTQIEKFVEDGLIAEKAKSKLIICTNCGYME